MKIFVSASLRAAVFSAALLFCSLASRGQDPMASGTLFSTQAGTSEWLYVITLTDAGSTPIDSLWYGWTPDVSPNFYLPGSDITDISGSDGWTGTAVANSIQFSAGTALMPCQTVTLAYEANFSPSTLANAPDSGLSVAYDGGIEAGPATPDFTIAAAPEPASLALFGTAIMGLAAARRLKK